MFLFPNTSSVYCELPPKHVFKMRTCENTLMFDILQPIICSNTLNSVRDILTKFLNSGSTYSFKSTKSASPYLAPLRKWFVHQRLRWHHSLTRNTCPAKVPATQHDAWTHWPGRETVSVDSPQTHSANRLQTLFADNIWTSLVQNTEFLNAKKLLILQATRNTNWCSEQWVGKVH